MYQEKCAKMCTNLNADGGDHTFSQPGFSQLVTGPGEIAVGIFGTATKSKLRGYHKSKLPGHSQWIWMLQI